MIFETVIKFVIVFVSLIFEKVGVEGLTGPRQETYIRYDLDLKKI